MTVDTTAPRSRRAILAASLGGAAALVANSLGRAAPVEAANGDTVRVGQSFTGTQTTLIAATGIHGIWGQSLGAEGQVGIVGTSDVGWGVDGESDSGFGVSGYSGSSIGVRGESGGANHGVAGVSAGGNGVYGGSEGVGVYGETGAGIGVVGASNTNFGIRGSSNAAAGVVGAAPFSSLGNVPVNTGVYGVSKVDTNSCGVIGESTSGRGVQGAATSGIGVRAHATSGWGLYATTSSGYAIRSVGRVRFEKSVGIATINAGTSSVVVTPGIDLTSASAVTATLNGDAGGSTAVKRVAINTTNNTFTIYLTANSTGSGKVAWHVFG